MCWKHVLEKKRSFQNYIWIRVEHKCFYEIKQKGFIKKKKKVCSINETSYLEIK